MTKKKDPLVKKIETLEAQVLELQTQAEESKNAQIRALADLENFRRRAHSQKAQWSESAVSQFIKKVIPSFLELALGAEHSKDKTLKKVIVKFFETLQKEGLAKIDPQAGEAIDPEKHEVLLAEESEKEGIVRCLEPGWKYYDSVVIPAKVSATQN